MKNLKIVFFGGTKVHFDLSEKCSKLGAKCFILDKNKKCFANFSTDFYNIDFSNKYKTLNFIKSKKIDFIYISQSDAGLMTLGYINSKLKLPGVTYKIAKILSNKFKIRKILKSNNFYQPKFYL